MASFFQNDIIMVLGNTLHYGFRACQIANNIPLPIMNDLIALISFMGYHMGNPIHGLPPGEKLGYVRLG